MPRKAKAPARDLDRVLDLLWSNAESGNVTAQKTLYDHYRRDEEPEEQDGEWSAIYGDDEGKVTPIRRRKAS